jgi:uncharacterized damage-inducible protein DinB
LYHIVVWQEFTISALQGENPDWKSVQDNQWLKSDQFNDTEFPTLIQRFLDGLNRLSELIDSIDMVATIPALGDSNAAHSILVNIQHNSYHIGQMYVMNQLLNDKTS